KGVLCNPCPGRRLLCFLILSTAMNTGQTTDPSSQQVPAPAPSQQPDPAQPSAEPQQPAADGPATTTGASGPLSSVLRGKGPLASRGASAKPESPTAKP